MALTNAQYDEIMRGYSERQTQNRRRQEERSGELYAEIPQLNELDQKISSVSVSCAKQMLSGDDNAFANLQKQLRHLQKQKSELIVSSGYSLNYLEPIYTCPDCQDTGYIGNERCHCFKQAAIDLVYTQSNLKSILEKENFSTFSFSYYSNEQINPATNLSALQTAENAVAECQRFIQNFNEEFSNLFFYGDTGVGKTFLSNCIAKELLDRGHSVIYVTSFELFHIFEKNVFERDRDMKEPYQNIFDCDLLIIDDLGTEMSNSFTVSQLFLCLNERILRKRSTIISTNLGLNQLADLYSERTFSRISSNYTIIKLFGDDIRIKKKLQ
ncbi:MAG: ATP-binding protein [Lachnospiraceae bacterium]|nr:ATP-binding protein [Lachnospiraceae bacterium]